MNDINDLCTVAEFAAFAKVSQATVRRLIKEGMPSLEVVGRKRVLKDQALRWLQKKAEKNIGIVACPKKTIYNNNNMAGNKDLRFSGENYSGNFDAKQARWKANVRKPDGKWTTKWCPKEFGVTQGVDAEAFIVGFLKRYYADWVAPTNNEVIAAKTLSVLIPRWLKLRYDSLGTKMNYYKSLSISARCWILDNKDFPHTSIEHLDIETEITIPVLRAWINSLKGAPRTRLASVNALSVFFDDAVDEGWISEDFVNPLTKRAAKKIVNELKKSAREASNIIIVPYEHVNQVTTSALRSIENVRKMKYNLVAATGMRDHELQGMVWDDVVLSEIPHVKVERQLLKRGCKPVKIYEQEIAKGVTKEELYKLPNALVSLPKRGSKRPIPLHPETVKALLWWRDRGWRSYVGGTPKGDDPIFPRSKTSLREGQNAGDFCIMMAAEILNEDLGRLGLPHEGVTFHALRRSFASELDKMGVDSTIIDRLMGHAKKSVAQKSYVKGALEPLYDAVCKLPIGEVTFGHTRLSVVSPPMGGEKAEKLKAV